MCAIKSVCVCVYLITWATSSIWLKFCTKTARLSWKSPSRVMVKWSPAMVFVCSTLVCVCVSLHACSSSAAPWPTGALLSDWRLAGELYDGAVSPAVSHSPGSGSPDTLRNTSKCNFSHILSELSFEWKNPPACLALFVFTNVWAKKMVICTQESSTCICIDGLCERGIFERMSVHFLLFWGLWWKSWIYCERRQALSKVFKLHFVSLNITLSE